MNTISAAEEAFAEYAEAIEIGGEEEENGEGEKEVAVDAIIFVDSNPTMRVQTLATDKKSSVGDCEWSKGLAELECAIGYVFHQKEILQMAFTHSSLSTKRHVDNERLEFLGDAVLDLIVREYYYHRHPQCTEGTMTESKTAVVCTSTLASISKKMNLHHYLFAGKDVRKDALFPDSILAGVYEALVAAVYLDGGYESANRFIFLTLGEDIERAITTLDMARVTRNPKSVLQEMTQKKLHIPPTYTLLSHDSIGSDNAFEISLSVNGQELARGQGKTKKEAEQNAARSAIARIKNNPSTL